MNPAAEPAQRLLNRNFLLLLQGKIVSGLGMAFYTVVVMLWLRENTDSGTIMGTVMMGCTLAMVIFGPLGGVLADRHSRKWIIVACDLLTGVLTLGVCAAIWLVPDDTGLIVTLIAIAFIISGAAMTVFGPASMALVPQLLRPALLPKANGLMAASQQFTMLLGQTIGGVTYRIFGGPILMLGASIGFIISGLTEMLIQEPPRPRRNAVPEGKALLRVWQETVEGFRALVNVPGMVSVIGMFLALQAFTAPMIIALPFYVEYQLLADPAWFGYLMGGLAGGQLLGGALSQLLPFHRGNRARWFLAFISICPVMMVVLGVSSDPVLSLAALVAMSTGASVISIIFMSTIQTRVPDAVMGRATSMTMTLTNVLTPLSMGVTGLLIDALDKQVGIILIAGGVAIALLIAQAAARGQCWQLFDYDEVVPEAA